MSKKLITLLLPLLFFAISVPAANASASSVEAGVSAAKTAKSEISIEIWPKKGAFGYVESGRKDCEAQRRVSVFKKLPGGELLEIGSDRTSKTDNGYIWSLNSRKGRSGTLVASAPATAKCAGDSVRKQAGLLKGNIPPCPSLADVCNLEWTKFDDTDSYSNRACRTFGNQSGQCKLEIDGGRVPYCCWATGYVNWQTISSTKRSVTFYGMDFIAQGQPEKRGPSFEGWMPNDRSADYHVTKTTLPPWNEAPKTEWYTPDIAGTTPGSPGGPLYFNWHAQADNHFYFEVGGFLYRKK